MKNLKKTLSLVLALIMCFGVFAISAGAASVDDFTDADTIDATYEEAVNVLFQLGILEGMEDGSFRPQNTLTREQGAKLIAYMMLGSTAADALTASSAPFSDVPATRWSAGYIAYCANEKIIDGYGNGNFGPGNTLTGFQFAKMLLTAVGYGANDEFIGDGWSINVAKIALKEGVFDGNTAGANNEPCTREEASLYVFNTLTSLPQVTYSPILGEYTTGGAFGAQTGATLGEDLYKLYKTDFEGSPISATAYIGKYYNAIASRLYNYRNEMIPTIPQTTVFYDLTTEDIGREGYLWVVADRNAVGGYRAVSNVIYTDNVLAEVTSSSEFLADTPFDNWATTSGMGYIAPYDLDASGFPDVTVYVNGREVTVSQAQNLLVGGTNSVIIDSDNNGAFDKIIAIRKDIGVVEDEIRTSGANTYIPGVTNRYAKTVGYENLKVGDVAAFYEDVDGTYIVEKLEPIKGQLTAEGMMMGMLPTYTFAGGFYMASADLTGYHWDVTQNVDAEIFLLNGSIVYGRNVSETSLDDVVFVLDFASSGLFAPTYHAQILFQDGTIITVETDEDYETFNSTDLTNKFVTFSTNSAGQYLFEAVALPTGTMHEDSAVDVTGGRAVFADGFVATNDTKFIVNDGTTWTAYTGIGNLGDSVSPVAVYALNDRYGYAVFVYIEGAMTGTEDIIYLVDGGSYTTYAKTATQDAHRVYSAVVDGEITTVKTKTNIVAPGFDMFMTGLVQVTYNSAGLIDSITPLTQAPDNKFAAGTGTNKAVAGTLTLEGNGTYTYNASTKVFVYENFAMREGTIAEIMNDDTDKYQLMTTTASGTVIDTIYVRKEVSTTNTVYSIQVTDFNNSVLTAPVVLSGAGAGTVANPYQGFADIGATVAGSAKVVADSVLVPFVGPQAYGFTSSQATVNLSDGTPVIARFSVTAENGTTAYYAIEISYSV